MNQGGWGLLNQFTPLTHKFYSFSKNQKLFTCWISLSYLTQLSCSDTCQIGMWLSKSSRYNGWNRNVLKEQRMNTTWVPPTLEWFIPNSVWLVAATLCGCIPLVVWQPFLWLFFFSSPNPNFMETSTGIDADASKGETSPGYFNSKLVHSYKCGTICPWEFPEISLAYSYIFLKGPSRPSRPIIYGKIFWPPHIASLASICHRNQLSFVFRLSFHLTIHFENAGNICNKYDL